MVLRYPLIIKIGIPVFLLLIILLHVIRRKVKYKGGKKVANTRFAKNLPEYRAVWLRYRLFSILAELGLIAAGVATLVLLARPAEVEKVVSGTKQRDIFLCLDVSYSICDLNYELVDNLKDVVANMSDEKFGISIFNTSTVLYVPMTDDYDFINQKLDELKVYFEKQREYMHLYYGDKLSPDAYERMSELEDELEYYDAGTLVNNYRKGSSLIGEGLASCMFSFPRLNEEDRTRVIIFSTDNEQSAFGKPLVELDEATDLCKKYGITVFSIYPTEDYRDSFLISENAYAKNKENLKYAVEKTGGQQYEASDQLPASQVIKSIQSQQVLEVENISIRKVTDKPFAAFIVLFSGLLLMAFAGVMLKI